MNNDLIPGPPREDRDRDSQAKVTGVTSTPQSQYHKGATGEALGALSVRLSVCPSAKAEKPQAWVLELSPPPPYLFSRRWKSGARCPASHVTSL